MTHPVPQKTTATQRVNFYLSSKTAAVKLPVLAMTKTAVTAIDWYDKSKVIKELQPFRNQNLLCHFTNVPKLGVNPSVNISHKDPRVVYFYPVDWVFSKTDRLKEGQQYATESRYCFVVKLLPSPNGINLETVTWEQVKRIAHSNGWGTEFDSYYSDIRTLGEEEFRKKYTIPYYAKLTPGWTLWQLPDSLVKNNKISWLKAFKGIDYIIDPNLGIIHSNEPSQVAVFNFKLLKIVKLIDRTPGAKLDSQRPDSRKFSEADYRTITSDVLNPLAALYKSKVTWKNKTPSLQFTLNNVNFSIIAREPKFSHWDNSHEIPKFYITYTFFRESGQAEGPDVYNSSVPEIIAHIKHEVNEILNVTAKGDLRFTPFLTEEQAKDKIITLLGTDNLAWTTEIYNRNEHSSLTVEGTYKSKIQYEGETVPVNTKIKVKVTVNDYVLDIQVYTLISAQKWVNFANTNNYSANGSSEAGFQNLKQESANYLETSIKHAWYQFRPEASSFPHFSTKFFLPAKGLVIRQSRLERMFPNHFREYLSAYDSLDSEDKNDLRYELVVRVLGDK